MSIRSGATRRYTPLFQRVAATNAIVLVSACVVTILVVSPHKLSSFAADEAVVLLAALIVVVAINLYLLRRALAPLEALTAVARKVDLTRPGQRVPVSDYESEASELAETFNEMLERLESERRDSTRRVLAAQESERLRIARELHDEVGQTLTAVLLQLGRTAKHAGPELAKELARLRRRRARRWRRCGASRWSCGLRRSTTWAWAARWWRSASASPRARAWRSRAASTATCPCSARRPSW